MQGAFFQKGKEWVRKFRKETVKKRGSKAEIDHAFQVFIFAVSCFYCLEFEDGDGGRVWEGKKTGSGGGGREGGEKEAALSHTGVEAEALARILLVMSAIWNVESLPLSVTVLERGCPKLLRPLPPASQQPEGALEATPVRTQGYWQQSRTSGADHIYPDALRVESGAQKTQRQQQPSAELCRGCSFSLIRQQSWEIIWISLDCRARLSGFSADWFPSGMFLPLVCVGVLAPREVWFVCFAIPGSSPLVCMQS